MCVRVFMCVCVCVRVCVCVCVYVRMLFVGFYMSAHGIRLVLLAGRSLNNP